MNKVIKLVRERVMSVSWWTIMALKFVAYLQYLVGARKSLAASVDAAAWAYAKHYTARQEAFFARILRWNGINRFMLVLSARTLEGKMEAHTVWMNCESFDDVLDELERVDWGDGFKVIIAQCNGMDLLEKVEEINKPSFSELWNAHRLPQVVKPRPVHKPILTKGANVPVKHMETGLVGKTVFVEDDGEDEDDGEIEEFVEPPKPALQPWPKGVAKDTPPMKVSVLTSVVAASPLELRKLKDVRMYVRYAVAAVEWEVVLQIHEGATSAEMASLISKLHKGASVNILSFSETPSIPRRPTMLSAVAVGHSDHGTNATLVNTEKDAGAESRLPKATG